MLWRVPTLVCVCVRERESACVYVCVNMHACVHEQIHTIMNQIQWTFCVWWISLHKGCLFFLKEIFCTHAVCLIFTCLFRIYEILNALILKSFNVVLSDAAERKMRCVCVCVCACVCVCMGVCVHACVCVGACVCEKIVISCYNVGH